MGSRIFPGARIVEMLWASVGFMGRSVRGGGDTGRSARGNRWEH